MWSLTSLFFTNDYFLFCRANLLECHVLKDILSEFASASRQMIYYNKISINFSRYVEEDYCQKKIAEVVGVGRGVVNGKYLGLPSLIGRKKKEVLGFIKDKVGKIHSWNN